MHSCVPSAGASATPGDALTAESLDATGEGPGGAFSSPTSPRSGGQKSPTSGGRRFAHASSGDEAIRFHSSERLWNVALHGWEERKAEAALRELIAPFGADEAEVALLKRYTQLLTLPRYTQLWRKGARMSSFYVLIRGRVRLSDRPAREHVHLARTLPPPG